MEQSESPNKATTDSSSISFDADYSSTNLENMDVFKLIPTSGIALDLSCINCEPQVEDVSKNADALSKENVNQASLNYCNLVNALNTETASYEIASPLDNQTASHADMTTNLLSDLDVPSFQLPNDSTETPCYKLLKDLDSGGLQLLKNNLSSLEPGELLTQKADEASKAQAVKQNWMNLSNLQNNLTYAIIDTSNLNKSTTNLPIISLSPKGIDGLQKIQLINQATPGISYILQSLNTSQLPQQSNPIIPVTTNNNTPTTLLSSTTTTPSDTSHDQQPSSTTDSSHLNYEEINTREVAHKISNELKKYSIPQAVFAQQVLGRSQGTLSDLLRNPKPWSKLKSGRETFRRMWCWLAEPESERMAQLRLCVSSTSQETTESKVTQAPSSSSSSSSSSSASSSSSSVSSASSSSPSATSPGKRSSSSSREGGVTGGCKKPRMVFTEIQRRTLVAIFKEIKRPSKEIQATIAEQLGLKVSTVVNFFMNARRRSIEKYLDDTVTTTTTSSSSSSSSSSSATSSTAITTDNISVPNQHNNNQHNNNLVTSNNNNNGNLVVAMTLNNNNNNTINNSSNNNNINIQSNNLGKINYSNININNLNNNINNNLNNNNSYIEDSSSTCSSAAARTDDVSSSDVTLL